MLHKKQQPNYGFPFSSILIRMLTAILMVLFIIALIFFHVPWYFILFISFIILPAYVFFGIIMFKKRFYDYRMDIQKKMIDILDIKGNESILDLGSGAGALVISFAKLLQDGKAYGLDKYSLSENKIRTKIIKFVRINYIGNTLKNAKRNAKIEDVDKKCEFIPGDFTRRLNFQDNCLELISSFQSLHITSTQKQIRVFQEIDRVLKKGGRIIFFEPSHFFGWDVNDVKNNFVNSGYTISITQLKTRVILLGKKL